MTTPRMLDRRTMLLAGAAAVVPQVALDRSEVKFVSLDTKAALTLSAYGQVHVLESPQIFFEKQLTPLLVAIGTMAKTNPELNDLLVKYGVMEIRDANGNRVWP